MTEPTHKAVAGPDVHEDHRGQILVTRNHDVIRAWAADREVEPATTRPAEGGWLPVDALRLSAPGTAGGETVSWDTWFEAFDTHDLRFLFREHEPDGATSTFWRFDTVDRDEG
ncbi:hypothetical protein [Jiangella mangrovi]|uniref:Uncharacterized protein n=1 Tax=Jiangella mangrovi TaxID=1524084 RepID=A0A7W9GW02_9ACTN|nr:hypothetical protein [Jiangella mangrovi]MBB5791075.1 hypothetical protein [Jiangella mangrovi]